MCVCVLRSELSALIGFEQSKQPDRAGLLTTLELLWWCSSGGLRCPNQPAWREQAAGSFQTRPSVSSSSSAADIHLT